MESSSCRGICINKQKVYFTHVRSIQEQGRLFFLILFLKACLSSETLSFLSRMRNFPACFAIAGWDVCPRLLYVCDPQPHWRQREFCHWFVTKTQNATAFAVCHIIRVNVAQEVDSNFSHKDTQDSQGGDQTTDCKDARISNQIFLLEKPWFSISED